MEFVKHAIILFCSFAAGLSKRTLENLRHDASCVSQCAEHSALNCPAGSKFSYTYSTSTTTFLLAGASKRSGLSLESTVVIQVLAKCLRVLKVQDVQLKAVFNTREELLKENSRLRRMLEHHPMWFCFHNGKILKIFSQESEPTWVLNIKRGILSILQTSWAAADNRTVEEVDVLGKCPTTYQRKGSLVLKTKSLNLCSHRFSGFTSLRSVPLPNAPTQEHGLVSNLKCVQSFEDGVLAEAKCTESDLITLSAKKGDAVETQTQTAMKLFRKETAAPFERVDTKGIHESNLLYEREKTARRSREEEVVAILQKLCLEHDVNFESADLFMTFVLELKQLSADALMRLWRTSSLLCSGSWQPLMDSLPACATEACVVLIKELIVSKEIEDDKIESFLWSFSFISEPTAGMIGALAPLLQLPIRRPSAFLGVTALLHHFCTIRADCDQEPAVQGVMRILEGYLRGNCSLHNLEEIAQVELALKSIGNAGLAAASLVPSLSSCATLKSNSAEVRLAAIEAFRRIPCAANNTVLVHLYQTYNEDVEIRIASYLMSMKCPSKQLFNQVKWTLQEEKSSQVGSFVWSHLSQLMETDDPMKQHLKNSLPDDILSREFDEELWKFSSYSDVTLRSAAASINAESRLVFSPASFIPRTIATNVTIHILGRAINLLELSLRLENVESVVQKFFGLHPLHNTEEKKTKPKPPTATVHKIHQNKLISKRDSLRNGLPLKDGKFGQGKQSCPSGQYNKMSELVKKFTKRIGKKKKPRCGLSIKIFGNELAILDCGDPREQMKCYYLNLAGLVTKLLKGQEVQFNKRLSVANERLMFPAVSGLPILLALNASAAVSVTIQGKMDFKQRNNFFIHGYIKPSAVLQMSAQMGTGGTLGKAGLNWATRLRSSTSIDGGIQLKRGKEFKIFLNTPEESMDVLYFSSKLDVMTVNGTEAVNDFSGHSKTKSCTNEEASRAFGWQLCSEIVRPDDVSSAFVSPFPGPIKVAIALKKQDSRLHQYLMKATYNYISQKDSWFPDEAGLHFYMGTPKSELKRDLSVDLHFNVPQKKFRIGFIQPKQKLQVDGKIEASSNSCVGHLEVILDDRDIYYVKGRTNLQTMGGEKRYSTQLEVKLLKTGSPIVLTGNVTKQPGKKMALSISLVNLLKDAIFLSVCLEKNADDKLKQYSLEGEIHFPEILGSHFIGLLQQRGHLWSNALRIKYGLFGYAENLQHECSMCQKLKVEISPLDAYRLDFEHEFHCSQILAYNHKVYLHHEETTSQLNSKLEVNYGKHWDEMNNMRKVLLTQTFRSNSNSSLTSYFMEFTLQVPEKEVDYRTQLQHTRSFQISTESSTHFKVQNNNHMPFVAGLQWKDSPRHYLKKREGMFNMDTPWLYLYVAHKLHQPQRSTYVATVELTTGKAFTIKGLVVEIFCKDKVSEKEGRIRIYTAATNYLQASTVSHLTRDFLHSQSEVVSIWNRLVRNEIHLENKERSKFLQFQIKSAEQELNMTATYVHLEPTKANVSVQILWTDYKNLPTELQLGAQIEEMRKDKMLYQKRGTVQFRHSFNMPILQSFHLQETFTVNKKEKQYILETQVLINGLDKSVQTLILGYQAENPSICVGLIHPYKNKIFPQNIDVCAIVQNLSSAQCEVDVTMKINKKDVLHFLGKYQKKSSLVSFQHLIQMDMMHSFQFSAGLNGTDTHFGIYSQLSHMMNQSIFLPSFQVQASANRYSGHGLNGSFYLHSYGKDLVRLEADFNSEGRGNTKAIELSMLLRQEILTQFGYLWLQLMGRLSASRLLLSLVMKLNQNSFHLGILGCKELKAGRMLTLQGNIQHSMESLNGIIPQNLSLNGSVKQKNNVHEGTISMMINQSVYGLHIRNRNVLGNISVHSVSLALTQKGSHTFPIEARLRGHLKLSQGVQKGSATIQMDAHVLCIAISNLIIKEQAEITGVLRHNISALYTAGLPTESSITILGGRLNTSYAGTIKLQRGNGTVTATFGVEKPNLDRAQLTGSWTHNIAELKKHGIPFVVGSACYYQNFNTKLVLGLMVQVEEEQFGAELENQGANSTGELALLLHHNMSLLVHVFPTKVQVQCDGESTSHQLWGRCSGELTRLPFEAPTRILLNGSMLATNCATNFLGEVVSHDAFVQGHVHATCSPRQNMEISLKHGSFYLKSLGLAQVNQIKVAAASEDGSKGLREAMLGECILTGQGELRTDDGGVTTEWRVSLTNQCDSLKDLGIPVQLNGSGYILLAKKHLDSQVLVTTNEHTFQGNFAFKVTNTKQELHALLNHSIGGIMHLGIPARTVIDLISEKSGTSCKRFLQFSVDSKQITEELNFTQRSNHVSLDYQLTHNLETLQALGVEDRTELQAIAVLNKIKNITMMIQYGSCWIITGGLFQRTEGRMDFNGNFRHKCSWLLLQSYIPEAIKMISSFDINATQERWMQILAEQTLITYSTNPMLMKQKNDVFWGSIHDDLAFVTSKAINLTFMLQKLENKASISFQGQYDSKSVAVTLGVFTGLGLNGPFEFTTEVKHSLNQLQRLGLPFSLKLTFLEYFSKNKTEASLKLACDPNLSLLLVFSATTELQSKELNLKSLQNTSFLLQYFCRKAEGSSKLTVLPRQLVFTTVYHKSKKNQVLRCAALWDEKEIKFTGSYSGLFPRISRDHDMKVEICHPFLIPFPQHSTLNGYGERSGSNPRHSVFTGCDSKQKVFVSSTLKIGKEHINYHATVAHPFNFTLNHIKVNSLTESRKGVYNQEMQLAWNGGQPALIKATLGDKSKGHNTLWNACITASAGQLQNILAVGRIQACGSIQQTDGFFTQHLDVKWDDKRVQQNLTCEKNQSSHLEKIQLETLWENVLATSCASQHVLGNMETDYLGWLNYEMGFRACGLQNAVVLSGKHQLTQGDVLLHSESKLNLAGNEGLITLALRNHSKTGAKNYSVGFALKTSEAVWLNMMGSLTFSAAQSQILVEGNVDPEEKVKLAVSKEKECLHCYVGYLKGNSEDGLEITSCMAGQTQAVLNAHLVVNGARQEEVGHLAVEAINQSLSLKAYGCREPLVKMESKLNEIATHLQDRLMAKIKKMEHRIWSFRKLVQPNEFMYDAAGWPLKASKEVAGLLQNGMREAAHMWKQSGVKRVLQNDLPLYLGKMQEFVQQLRNELQRPLTTLKDAYYDATLKPLDEVWQQKTEKYLKKLQAFLPSVIKDVWLIEPIQVTLRTLKTGFDMATQQMLSRAEAKFSRAVSKIWKPLSNLYTFSARNCSVAVRLPVLPEGESPLDLANITNYLIEEKLIKFFRQLYNINPAAEYYRFKRTMMESPFEHHAMLIGNQYLRTFDGKMYSLTSRCSVLLAKDFVSDAFTIVLNQDSNSEESLRVTMNGTAVIIYPQQKTYKKYSYSLSEESCHSFGIPLEESGASSVEESDYIEVSSTNGALFSCDLHHNLCTLLLDGWHHGTSAGLFGTNDNEAGNEWMLPDHSYTDSLQEFKAGWQVSSPCVRVKKTDKQCPSTSSSQICKTFFQDSKSFFRNCFKVVDPEPFYSLCTTEMCEVPNLKAACALGAGYVHLCHRNYVPLEMPLQCGGDLRLRGHQLAQSHTMNP